MEVNNDSKVIHPNVKDSRVLTYLNIRNKPTYVNTEEENILLNLWREKYYQAKSEYERSRCNSTQVKLWRNAFSGTFYKLDENNKPTQNIMKPIRKLAFELVEGKVNSSIPAPKMSPRYHADLTPVNATEHLIQHEIDKMLSEQVNDESEHNCLIDGASWFKVTWDPFDNTHERSGNPKVYACPVDTVYPQPGVKNYKELEYIFEVSTLTVAQCLDLYNREIKSPDENDIIPVINCYFLNEDRYVGKFTWCEETSQVICNDLEWGIRKRRECTECHNPAPIQTVCPVCGSKHFKYVPVATETLEDDLVYVTNPYRVGKTEDETQDNNQEDEQKAIPAGTELPHYLIRQLPFVPYRRVSVPGSIYGMSEVELVLETQDIINKLLNKAERKSARSKTLVTKLKDTRVSDKSDELSYVEVESPQEGQSIQVKQVMSDISEEITQAQVLYEIAKSTVGTTDTDQGKNDPSARSGKAKQLQMQASAQRKVAPDTLRNLAFSGVYELIFKNLLAYSDESRSFVTLLPDGTKREEVWSKYMFLSEDSHGEYYYRDDFAWSVDTATEITQDRAAMWQLIDNDFINGTMGTQIDPQRALKMYWQMKEQFGYPTAKYALEFLDEGQKHLPTQVEQALVNDPEALQVALQFMQNKQQMMGLGGNSSTLGGNQGGRSANGQSHAANVEKTNNKNRAQSGAGETTTVATAQGGMQGGTATPETSRQTNSTSTQEAK